MIATNASEPNVCILPNVFLLLHPTMTHLPEAIEISVWAQSRGKLLQLLLVASLLGGTEAAAQTASPAAVGTAAAVAPQVGYSVQVGPAPAVGGEGVLTLVGAVGAGAGLQWQRKAAGEALFINLPETATYRGVTTATLRVEGAAAAMSGDQFRCVVGDAGGVATTAAAALTVGPPVVAIVGGNDQMATPGEFNPRPFDLAVWDAAGTQPLPGAPVTFTVEAGGGLLAASNTPSAQLGPSLTLNTDPDGTVQAYYRHSLAPGLPSTIKAVAGTTEVTLHATSLGAGGGDNTSLTGSDAGAGRTTAGGSAHRSGTGAGVIAGSGVSGSTGAGGSNVKELANNQMHADTAGLTLTLVTPTPGNDRYTVNTDTWAIALDTSGQPSQI
jgi:hypothetical protein